MNKVTNLPPQFIYQNETNQEDEIDLSVLFNKIWLRRKFIVAFVFVAVVLVSGVMAIKILLNPPEQRLSEIIQFTFPSADQGRYPSGQKFSHNDVVSAEVLEKVYKNNNLKNINVDFNKFISSITVNPFAQNAEFIKEKYQGLLGKKELTRPEIESIEKSFLEELSISQSRFVRLSIVGNVFSDIDPIVAQKVLSDIPKTWSQNAIDDLGVLNLKVVGSDFYQAGMFERFEYLQFLEYAKGSASVLETALNKLILDDVGGQARNQISGMAASDVQVQLKNLVAFEIEPLFSTVTNLGLSKNRQKTITYLKNTVQGFEDNKALLIQKASNIAQIIEQYSGINVKNSVPQASGSSGGFSQYDSSFLDKFTQLIEDKNDKNYIQSLLNNRLDVLQQIEDIDGQIIKFRRAEEKLLASDSVNSEQISSSIIDDLKAARDNFERLIAEYKGLLQIRNQQVLGDTGLLYQLASNDVLVESDMPSKIKKSVLILILVAIVALMLAVVTTLFKPLPAKPAEIKLNSD